MGIILVSYSTLLYAGCHLLPKSLSSLPLKGKMNTHQLHQSHGAYTKRPMWMPFLLKWGLPFMLSSGSQLLEFRSKRASRGNIHYLYIYNQSVSIWLESLCVANNAQKSTSRTKWEKHTWCSICQVAQRGLEAIWQGVFVYFKWMDSEWL